MCPPETQQMADLADAAVARERRRKATVQTTETLTIKGELTLDHLRMIVEHTRSWDEDTPVRLTEYKSYPGEPGSTPASITVTRD